MTISNHVLVGGGIALAIHQPILALPLAFLSHFALDALPHFGYNRRGYGEALKHKVTYLEEAFNALGLIIIGFTFSFTAWPTLASAILAFSPDLEWPYRYLLFERKGKQPPTTFLTKFHIKIQWCERPWGIFVEVIFFVIVYSVIHMYLLH